MQVVRKPRIVPMILRVAVITALLTLLTFAVTLFLSIVTILLVDMIRGGNINLAMAYRHVALPVAIVALVIALIWTLRVEIRHYRDLRSQYRESLRAA